MQLLCQDTSTRFLHNFWGVRQRMFHGIGPKIKEAYGLELGEVFLMHHIRDSDMTPSAIADYMQLPAHTISRRLDTLEKRHLIERRLDPRDARRRVLVLTEEGTRTVEAATKLLHEEVGEMLSVLEPEVLEALLEAMERIGRAAGEAKEPS
jgi:DNA-binding MarR family transcriptional regulator